MCSPEQNGIIVGTHDVYVCVPAIFFLCVPVLRIMQHMAAHAHVSIVILGRMSKIIIKTTTKIWPKSSGKKIKTASDRKNRYNVLLVIC